MRSEGINQLHSICFCPGIMGRGGRANLEKTRPDKNNGVELDQRKPPGVCPFVRSILGRAEAASKSKRQSSAWGKWSLRILWEGRSCSSAAARMLETGYPPSESPDTDHHHRLFLPEAAFQGKIYTHRARNVAAERFCQKLLVCQKQHTSRRFVSSEKVLWKSNEKTLKKSGNLIQFFCLECFNFPVSK